ANLIALCVVAGHLVVLLWDFLQRTVRVGGDGTPETGRRIPGGRIAPDGSPLLLITRFCVSVVVGALLVSPMVIAGHSQQASQIGGYTKPGVAQLIGVTGGLWQELFSSVAAAAVIMLLAVASLVAARGARRRTAALYALAFAIAPVIAVWGMSRGTFSYWMFRYMLFSIFGWALGAGLCIAYLGERIKGTPLARLSGSLSPRLVLAAVLVVLVGAAGIHDQLRIRQNEAHNLWAYPDLPSNGTPVDYRAAAAVIAANQRPGDRIAYETGDLNHYQVNTAMAYYLRDKVPPSVFQSQTQVQANSLQPVECQDPSRCITGTPRLWVVYVDHLATDPFSALPSTTVGNNTVSQGSYLEILGYQVESTWQEDGITVALLTVP
ncbi:MAG: hypothetical protein ACRDNS_00850, partial [Trebonia sp.]